ncbi:cyclic nucleotide-binding domain-containing protein [Kordiimonas aestuarii]|uniref:cyclic nucleotide-binding domain-containing protein n=1 Tax=Kordiimonas aestuarii TaxID=1005925 RepID=UPI0021CF7264|nr:cyclic nucleotide-binding domain-containing protein [Kordiimonas aestuarii]
MTNAMNMGEQVKFNAGDTIYEQESASNGVYMILDGQVEIWRHEGTGRHHIASLGGGELLGEVSVIERKDHSVTAKASRETTALFISADAFRKSFADPLVRHVVHTLATRLRSSYAIKEAIEGNTELKAHHFKSKQPTIEGLSRVVADKLLTFVEILEFPFSVGNIASKDGHCVAIPNSLRVPLKGVPELADNHFEIVRRDGALWVRDLGAVQGTLVNGEKLSRYAMNATAKLRTGRNEVVAGGPDSPVRFLVSIPPQDG